MAHLRCVHHTRPLPPGSGLACDIRNTEKARAEGGHIRLIPLELKNGPKTADRTAEAGRRAVRAEEEYKQLIKNEIDGAAAIRNIENPARGQVEQGRASDFRCRLGIPKPQFLSSRGIAD